MIVREHDDRGAHTRQGGHREDNDLPHIYRGPPGHHFEKNMAGENLASFIKETEKISVAGREHTCSALRLAADQITTQTRGPR